MPCQILALSLLLPRLQRLYRIVQLHVVGSVRTRLLSFATTLFQCLVSAPSSTLLSATASAAVTPSADVLRTVALPHVDQPLTRVLLQGLRRVQIPLEGGPTAPPRVLPPLAS
jgi:hypothetical protein